MLTSKGFRFCVGDKIILSCKPEGIVEAHEMDGLDLFSMEKLGIQHISSRKYDDRSCRTTIFKSLV